MRLVVTNLPTEENRPGTWSKSQQRIRAILRSVFSLFAKFLRRATEYGLLSTIKIFLIYSTIGSINENVVFGVRGKLLCKDVEATLEIR